MTDPSQEHGREPKWSASTLAVHADDVLNNNIDVAPPIHMSTTFDHEPNPDTITPEHLQEDPEARHVYSRESAPNTSRLESILTHLIHAPTITYSSGLSALFAVYTALRPKRTSITGGYHGAHGVISIHQRLYGLEVVPLDCPAEALHEGDVIHLETPLNPTGEASNIAAFAEKAHSRGALLLVDSTFGPPGLQDPFEWGADVVMHSGTKYIGGHSDMLCGTLSTRDPKLVKTLIADRMYLGSVMGSLEGWLGVRSVRTLELRVQRQSANCTRVVQWLDQCLTWTLGDGPETEEVRVVKATVLRVQHASLQVEEHAWLKRQMPNGYGPVFSFWMQSESFAKRLPSKLELFRHATSLGGVESLIEWRTMSDEKIDTRVMRVSIGVESWEDLKLDLLRAFTELQKEVATK